jgi:hypothetical protein
MKIRWANTSEDYKHERDEDNASMVFLLFLLSTCIGIEETGETSSIYREIQLQ